MSNNGAPESWEAEVIGEQGAKDSNDVSNKLSTLNVNAMEFVPTFCKDSGSEDGESPSTPVKSVSGSVSSTCHTAGSPILNGKSIVLSR